MQERGSSKSGLFQDRGFFSVCFVCECSKETETKKIRLVDLFGSSDFRPTVRLSVSDFFRLFRPLEKSDRPSDFFCNVRRPLSVVV